MSTKRRTNLNRQSNFSEFSEFFGMDLRTIHHKIEAWKDQLHDAKCDFEEAQDLYSCRNAEERIERFEKSIEKGRRYLEFSRKS